MKSYTVRDAADKLGITPEALRQRLHAGTAKGRRTQKGWRVYLNGDEPRPKQEKPSKTVQGNDPLEEIADELISLGRRLKKAIKDHDQEVRRETINDLGVNLVETAQKG